MKVPTSGETFSGNAPGLMVMFGLFGLPAESRGWERGKEKCLSLGKIRGPAVAISGGLNEAASATIVDQFG
jgi:hypothetical protein